MILKKTEVVIEHIYNTKCETSLKSNGFTKEEFQEYLISSNLKENTTTDEEVKYSFVYKWYDGTIIYEFTKKAKN